MKFWMKREFKWCVNRGLADELLEWIINNKNRLYYL